MNRNQSCSRAPVRRDRLERRGSRIILPLLCHGRRLAAPVAAFLLAAVAPGGAYAWTPAPPARLALDDGVRGMEQPRPLGLPALAGGGEHSRVPAALQGRAGGMDRSRPLALLALQDDRAGESDDASGGGGVNWVVVAGIAAATAGAFVVDEDVRDYMRDHKSGTADTIEDIGYQIGRPPYTVSASVITFGVGALVGSDRIRETGLMMCEAMLVTGMIQQPLRAAVGRARPKTGMKNTDFDPLTIEDDYASFIAGHSWSAITLATVVSRQVGHPVATAALYGLAFTTPFSRQYSNHHWLSDNVLGVSLGYLSGRMIWNWHRDRGRDGVNFSVIPTPEGLVAQVRF